MSFDFEAFKGFLLLSTQTALLRYCVDSYCVDSYFVDLLLVGVLKEITQFTCDSESLSDFCFLSFLGFSFVPCELDLGMDFERCFCWL